MMRVSLPLKMIPNNDDLLAFSCTLRVELENLIYTIEQSGPSNNYRFVAARERLAAGLVKYLNAAVLSQPNPPGSAIAPSYPTPKESVSIRVNDPVPAPTRDYLPELMGNLSKISPRETSSGCSSSQSSEGYEGGDEDDEQPQLPADVVAPCEPKSDANSWPPSSDGRPAIAGPFPIIPSAVGDMIPPEFILQSQANRSLLIQEIPTKVTLEQIFARLCGGAIERIECFMYKRANAYGASISFVDHSAAKNFLSYSRTPLGRLVFPGVPKDWTFDINWNPRFLQPHYRVMSMTRDPRIRARRCLTLRNLPIDFVDPEMLYVKLGELGGNFSGHPRVLHTFVDKERNLARISMVRISCAIQLMESKIMGRWGEQFDDCTLEFDKDYCERPIPGSYDESLNALDTFLANPEYKSPIDPGYKAPIDRAYESLRSHQDFQKMRSLYIPTLPINITISDLAAQIRGGALERITLNKKADSGMLTASVTFVHHSSARAWYEHTNGPTGGLRFPGVVWNWFVRWETSTAPIGRDILHAFIDPAIKARRGFVVKNLPSQKELSVETLKEDVLSQSKKRLSFEKFEIDWKKREATVIMASIGSAMGGVTMIKRFSRYKGCRIEYIRDECEDPIPIPDNDIAEKPIPDNDITEESIPENDITEESIPDNDTAEEPIPDNDITETPIPGNDIAEEPTPDNDIAEKQTLAGPSTTNPIVKDIDVITQNIVQQVSHTKTVIIGRLGVTTTLDQLSNRIRGGALNSLQIRLCGKYSQAFVTFLDSHTAEAYFRYLIATASTSICVSWGREDASKSDSPLNKDVRRVLNVRGFPSVFTEERIKFAIQKVVKHSAWVLKIGQRNTIESIEVSGNERRSARVVLASIVLAVRVMAELPRFWSSEFARDECEGPLEELKYQRYM